MSSLTNESNDRTIVSRQETPVSRHSPAARGTPAPATQARYRALLWLTTAAALAYLCRHAIGVPEKAIRAEFGLTLQESGLLQGAFFWTYAVLQVPGGWLAERRGTRISLGMFAITWSIAMLVMGVAPAFFLLVAAQLAMGAAQAGMLPAAYNSVGHWMPISQRAFGCGVISAGMQVGAIAAAAYTATLMAPLGWRWIFVAFAVPGIVWAIGFLAWFRDRPSEASAVNASELSLILAGREALPADSGKFKSSESAELFSMARSPVVWWLCAQQICRAAGYSFFVSWLPTFLQETRGVSVATAGLMQSSILAAMLPGTILSGLLTDWIWKRTGSLRASRSGVAVVSLAGCAISILAAWFLQSPQFTVGFLAVGGFLAALGGPCAFAAVIDIAGPRVPQVVGVINMTGNFAAAACPILVAGLFESNPGNWNHVLLLFAGVYLASAGCWLYVNPKAHVN